MKLKTTTMQIVIVEIIVKIIIKITAMEIVKIIIKIIRKIVAKEMDPMAGSWGTSRRRGATRAMQTIGETRIKSARSSPRTK